MIALNWNYRFDRCTLLHALTKFTVLLCRLVGKVTHKDIDARIRCLQVVYPHGEDKLPWVVLATSEGTLQIWNFASFALDESSPEESNKSVEPLASTTLLTKPRATCLSAVVASEKSGDQEAEHEAAFTTSKRVKRTKNALDKKPPAPAAGVPHVVVEIGEEASASKKRTKAASTPKRNSKKKKQRKQTKSQQ